MEIDECDYCCTDTPVCPYCGHEQGCGVWCEAQEGENTWWCDECEKEFDCLLEYDPSFTSSKKDEDNEN